MEKTSQSPQEQIAERLETKLNSGLELEKQSCVEAIKANGLEASMETILAWTAACERWVDSAEGGVRGRRSVLFNLARHELYLAAGDDDGALECLDDAMYQAEQEGFDDLAQMIIARVNGII
jgi:hypothetical protein